MAGCGAALASFFFEYDTPRIVLIRSRRLGLMNRGVQLLILAYIVGWVFVWEKGYQVKDSVISSVITKVKGVSVTNTSNMGLHVWDGANYMVPVQKDNSLFIMTNMIVTLNQRQNTCAEFPNAKTKCNSDDDCSQGSMQVQGSGMKLPSNGVETGRCVHFNAQVKTCEVIGWCPVENDTYVPRPAILNAAENFTIMVKNLIWYPKFNFTKRNILPSFNNTYLKSCIYDAKTDPLCPIFRIGHIAQLAGQNFQEMAVKGGILGISIDWDCNLDWAFSYCLPKYSFRRLDDQGFNYTVSSGYNFRFAKFFRDANGTEVRTLFKAFGIRFDILVFGKAGKFDIIPTMINIGSGLGLFGVATVLCDVIVLYFMKKRYYYREKKFKYVEDYDQGLTETFRTE